MNANLKLTYSDFEVESPAGDVPRIKINFKIDVGKLSSKDDILVHIEQINYDVDVLSMNLTILIKRRDICWKILFF
jgi:hypothetical protein